jgi:hypothetical protein
MMAESKFPIYPETIEERIWDQSAEMVVRQLKTARNALLEAGGIVEPAELLRRAYESQVNEIADANTAEWPAGRLTAGHIGLILLTMPIAAQASRELKGASSRAEKRPYRRLLARFNQDLAGMLSNMEPSIIDTYAGKLCEQSEHISVAFDIETFGSEEFMQRVHGMEREVAFERALSSLLPEGYILQRATVEEDIQGVDLFVTSPEGVQIRIDLKTAASFKSFMLNQYKNNPERFNAASRRGYATTRYGVDNRRTIIVNIVDADSLGKIDRYEYSNPEAVLEFVMKLMNTEERRIARASLVGRTATGGRGAS